jgi:hypothetical protein
MKYKIPLLITLCLAVSIKLKAQGGHQFRLNTHYGRMQHSQMGAFLAGPEWAIGQGKHQFILGADIGFAEGHRNVGKARAKEGGLLYLHFRGNAAPFVFSALGPPDYIIEISTPRSSTTHQFGGRAGYMFRHFTPKWHLGMGGGWYCSYVNKLYTAVILPNTTVVDDIWGPNFTSVYEDIDLDIHYWVRYLHMGPYVQGHMQLARKGSVQPGISLAYHHGFGGIGWVSAGLQVAFGM